MTFKAALANESWSVFEAKQNISQGACLTHFSNLTNSRSAAATLSYLSQAKSTACKSTSR